MTKDELRAKANDLPLLPGVYLMMDKTGKVIYVEMCIRDSGHSGRWRWRRSP